MHRAQSFTASKKAVASDLLSYPFLGRLLRWRHARTILQVPLFLLAALIVFDGLLGPQLAPKNLATVSVWIHYRGLAALALLLVGNLFCLACPFMLPRQLSKRLQARLGFGCGWPRRLRNKWLAVGLLALFLFSYEWFDLWASPWLTAWLVVGYFGGALVVDTLFHGAAFCKYVCPLGQFNFFGSLNSPFEVAVRSPNICMRCSTKDCIAGNRRSGQRGCELWLFQQAKSGNMDCTFCLDCIVACPHDNVGIRSRLPTSELWQNPWRSGIGRFWQRTDLTALVVVITFGAYLNAFGMIRPIYTAQERLMHWLGASSPLPALLFIFALGLVGMPLLLLLTAGAASLSLAPGRASLKDVIRRYVYSLVPLGFGMWLAHYAFHFLSGALTIIPVTQTFLAESGFDTGPADWQLAGIVPVDWIFAIQIGLMYVGCVGAIAAAIHISRSLSATWQGRVRSAAPWIVLHLALFVAGLMILSQPMEMRGTFM